jgi:hypothetical protein
VEVGGKGISAWGRPYALLHASSPLPPEAWRTPAAAGLEPGLTLNDEVFAARAPVGAEGLVRKKIQKNPEKMLLLSIALDPTT